MRARCTIASALLLVACGGSDPLDASTAPPIDAAPEAAPAACASLGSDADRFACAETEFWDAFTQPGLDLRMANEATLRAVIAAATSAATPLNLSVAHFRLGQLRLALALENGQSQFTLHATDDISGEFATAISYDAYGGVIAPWKDAMDIALAAVIQDWTTGVSLAQRGFDNVKLNPMGNTLSLSGTTIGFPMSTGVPQQTTALLDAWTCTGVAWCTDNTAHASFARPGLSYHFAEAYARVGDRDKAAQFLAQSLASPGADVWPYRAIAADAAADVDALLKKFSDLGADGSAFDVVYANQPYGCLFCHQRP